MSKEPKREERSELDVNLDTGELIPEDSKKEFKSPEATKAGSLKDVSRLASGDGTVT